MGVWNAHTSVGNIGGSLVAAAALGYGWGWAFVVPGAALVAAACLIWLLLAAEPEEAGLERDGTSELQVQIVLHLPTVFARFLKSVIAGCPVLPALTGTPRGTLHAAVGLKCLLFSCSLHGLWP